MRSTCLRVSKRPNFRQLWRLCFAECTRCAECLLSPSPMRNIFSSSLHPMKYKTTNSPPWTNSNPYFKYLTLVGSTRLSFSDTSRKVVTYTRIHSRLHRFIVQTFYSIFSVRLETISNRVSPEQSSNSERAISVIESCKWTFLFSLRQSGLCGGILGR